MVGPLIQSTQPQDHLERFVDRVFFVARSRRADPHWDGDAPGIRIRHFPLLGAEKTIWISLAPSRGPVGCMPHPFLSNAGQTEHIVRPMKIPHSGIKFSIFVREGHDDRRTAVVWMFR